MALSSCKEWASYQIREIAGCACAGNAGNVFPTHRLQWKPLVSDPGMHHGTCVAHVPWCMSGSLACVGGENDPGITGACAPAILRIWQEAHVYKNEVLKFTYRQPWVRDRRRQHGARVCQHQSRWRTCWRNRHPHRWSCRWASDRPAGCHAPDSRAPSSHYRSGRRPGRCARRYIHAWWSLRRVKLRIERRLTVRRRRTSKGDRPADWLTVLYVPTPSVGW